MENFIKIKNFHSPKDSIKRVKKQAKDLDHVFNKVPKSRIHKEFLQTVGKKETHRV